MAVFNKYSCFVEDLAEKVHNLGSDSLYIALASGLNANSGVTTLLSGVGEIVQGNGYIRSGLPVTVSSSAQTGGFYKLVLNSPAPWTGTPNAMAAFRFAVLYNDTAANDPLIGYWDYGSSVTLNSGETFTVTLDSVNGTLTVQ